MPSKSKQQQKFMGMVHSLQKGDMKPSDASAELKRAAKSLGKKDAKDYASTPHKGLPRKVKQEILGRLKEYASKMGTNTMGGDSIPSAKKGGLRDFDGYDNVDYNRDMPMDESHYTAIANLGTKKAKENLDSFDELQKFMNKMKSRKAISVQVTKINGSKKQTINYDWDGKNWVSKNKKGVQENFPSNWLQGRVSDYHTKKGTTPRDAYDKTNFNTKHSGQDDLEDGELEESGKDKSEKNYKAWKSSRIKKEIVRKLREWGSNLDNSYILDKDSILKGTPEDKDAIKREDIVDQAFNKAKVVDEACWKGYKQVGGKMKNGKQVPNCVPESVDNEIDETAKRDYKAEYKKFQSSTKAKKYRAELNKYNRQKGTYGNGDGKDASHKGGKIVGFESESKNRGRREKSRLKKK